MERKGGETNYFTTQALTGHGVCNTYLYKIGEAHSPSCWYCEAEDSPEHTLFHCKKFSEIRTNTNNICKEVIRMDNVFHFIEKSEMERNAVFQMLEEIIKTEEATLENSMYPEVMPHGGFREGWQGAPPPSAK